MASKASGLRSLGWRTPNPPDVHTGSDSATPLTIQPAGRAGAPAQQEVLLAPQRSLNTTPIFQVMFAVQNAAWQQQQLEGLIVRPERMEPMQVRFDLEVHAWEQDGEMDLYWVYNRDLFDSWRMEQMAGHYVRVLKAIAGESV